MRSELVFGAMKQVPNRFLLTNIAAKATRKLHRPSTRIQETMDDVFERFSHTDPVARMLKTRNAQPLHPAKSARPPFTSRTEAAA
jgi:hypothetical protein